MVYLDALYGPFWKISINAITVGNNSSISNGAYFDKKDAYLDISSLSIKIPSSIGP